MKREIRVGKPQREKYAQVDVPASLSLALEGRISADPQACAGGADAGGGGCVVADGAIYTHLVFSLALALTLPQVLAIINIAGTVTAHRDQQTLSHGL